MQWVGWGMAVAAEAALVVVALRLLTDWPDHAGAVALALTGLSRSPSPRHAADGWSPGSTVCSPTPSRSPG